ncbi:MAG: ATP synthase F1 subunit epsilon [Rhodospirillaceae bacterium]|nr:MAG: ATP synthase F1 subunit epsilon [Rhodospirillaceae bacterium]
MAATLHLEVVSPEHLLLSAPVEMVVVPGTEGYFGVLPQHMLLLSTLRPGVIDVYTGGAISERYYVTGGFAEVTGASCTVLVDEALPLTSLTKAFVADRLAKAKAKMDAAATEEDTRRAAEAIVNAEAMAEFAV